MKTDHSIDRSSIFLAVSDKASLRKRNQAAYDIQIPGTVGVRHPPQISAGIAHPDLRMVPVGVCDDHANHRYTAAHRLAGVNPGRAADP